MTNSQKIAAALSAVVVTFLLSTSPSMRAQGCVAAHSPQPVISGLDPTSEYSTRRYENGMWWRGLTITTGYRVYNSFRHYIGTVYQVQRQTQHTAVLNHVNLFEADVNYQFTPRMSFIATVPGMEATRHGESSPLNVYRSGGIGDVTLGVQSWIFRPPTENHGNVAISAQLKLPTGINDAKGTKTNSNGTTVVLPFDESIQPGDGTWGFSLATQAYKEFIWRTSGYFTGSWLFSPQDTTGVPTGRSGLESVISATDQYLWRGGFSRPVTGVKPLRGMALSVGGRMEGVPVRDAFGKSDGFRRPGYVISIEPGLTYERGRTMINVSGPWAMERNRKTSVADYANHTHGDAAFADYTVIAGVTHSF